MGAARNQLCERDPEGKGYFKVKPSGSGKLMSVQSPKWSTAIAVTSEGTQGTTLGPNQQPSKWKRFLRRAVLLERSPHSPKHSQSSCWISPLCPQTFNSGAIGTSVEVSAKLSYHLKAKISTSRKDTGLPGRGWAFSPARKLPSGSMAGERLCDQQTCLHKISNRKQATCCERRKNTLENTLC